MRRAGALVGLGRIVGAVLSGASDSELVRVSMRAAGELFEAETPKTSTKQAVFSSAARGRTRRAIVETSATVDGVPVRAELVDGSERRRYRPK